MNKKSYFYRSVIGSICLIILGLMLLANPDFGSVLVSNIIGWVLVILGGLACVYGVLNWQAAGVLWTVISAVVVLIGAFILWKPLMLAKLIGILMGLYLAFQGAGVLRTAIKLKCASRRYAASLALALLLLLFGVVLMFLPLTTSRMLMTLAGSGMLICGVVNLIVRARMDKAMDDNGPDIVDADP